jgi:hypothetical protein
MTASDGSVPGWYNVGTIGSGSAANVVWPGPAGQFGSGSEPASFSDNGYLARWNLIGDTEPGYIASMVTFLRNLGSGFPLTISSHTGPPGDSSNAYADSEAIVASESSIGFGMQTVNVGDNQTYAAGLSAGFPTSRNDWAHNFQTYPAPVHHLQMSNSGTTFYAEGYPIGNISIASGSPMNRATITCQGSSGNVDCSPLYGQPIYVSGNSDDSLNGIWQVSCSGTGGQCPANQLQFSTNLPACSPCGTGGTVWSPDFWPMVMPFTILRGASSVELWECSLDYAYGVQTTTWVPDESDGGGCASWGVAGPDSNYQNVLTNTTMGLPPATSILAGQGWLINGWQF